MPVQSNFDIAQKFTKKWEGGLCDDKYDAGGITKYGVAFEHLKTVSPAFLNSIGIATPVTRQSIKDLTYEQAVLIFRHDYWDETGCQTLPLEIAILVYDASVNHGPHWGVVFAQRGFNALFEKGKIKDAGFSMLRTDGKLGPLTHKALSENNCKELRQAILDARETYYHAIVNRKPTQKVFLKGWLNRLNDLRKYVEQV